MDQDFSGKVALVTGAASGIGRAVAEELAGRGAKVVVADLHEEALAAVVEAIKGKGGEVRTFALDVADAAKVEALVQFAEKEFGALHLAVNNAGIGGASATTADYPLDGWARVIDVNLNSVFYCTKFEIAAMQRAGGGSIVNMASILGSVGFANSSAYVAAKHGVVGFTKTTGIEYAPEGIRVNAVGPGFIETPLISQSMDADTQAAVAALHPAGRMGTPEEVSALTCFLLSDRASFITGSYHLVDGGYVAK